MKRSIPIAVSTGSFYPRSTLDSLEHLAELGIDRIELTLQANEFMLDFRRQLTMPILPELLKRVDAGKLWVGSVHAPSIAAQHANILWARREYLRHALETCRRLGAGLLVIHPLHLLLTQEAALEYLDERLSLASALIPGIEAVLEQAALANITLALENIQDWLDEIFFNTPVSVARFLREMDHPALGCTLDLMHAQVAGLLDEFAGTLQTEIVNLHASDFLPPGKRVAVARGNIDWQSLASQLHAMPNLRQVTVELNRSHPAEVAESFAFLSQLLA